MKLIGKSARVSANASRSGQRGFFIADDVFKDSFGELRKKAYEGNLDSVNQILQVFPRELLGVQMLQLPRHVESITQGIEINAQANLRETFPQCGLKPTRLELRHKQHWKE